ncbi:hypothetical protein PFTANZ_05926, partial [Plasmodium falciparum Tanzania (2000708)]
MGSLQEACGLKYGPGGKENFPNWKCISDSGVTATGSESGEAKSRHKRASSDESATPSAKSDATSSGTNQGSICVPPRRRKLYIHDLKTLDEKPSDTALRTWFVKSAAVETFFLWHKYKTVKQKELDEKKKQQQENVGLLGGDTLGDSGEQTPENQLLQGTIPEEFKRQMFYTLADYRDLCVGNTDILEAAVSSTEQEKAKMQQLQAKIQEHIKRGDKNGDKEREKWWTDNVESIWNGMICALTYKDSGAIGGTPQKVQAANDGKNLFDTLKTKYQYDQVKLDENSGAKPQTAPSTSDNTPTTKLSDFVEIPPFFRWLHEWGSDFCGKRARMLEKIRGECKVEENGGKKTQRCSGFGEDCKNNLNKPPSTLSDLECPDCGKYCSSYKKWIQRKKEEFTEQANAYKEQQKNCQTENNGAEGNNGGNGFCGTLEENAAAFLDRLKSGPCKKDNKDNGNDKLDFTNPNETFAPAANCAPCSQFTVDCKNCNGGGTKVECKDNKITAENIKNSTEIDMLVSDNSKKDFESDLKDACQDVHIFKGIRKDVWECGKVCGYVVCKPKNANGKKNEKENQNQIIIIRALVTHWVHNFLDDYNKIRKKLNPCINDGKQPKCIKTCDKKCNCVVQWIEKKRDEWKKIKEHYQKQYGDNDSYNSFSVRSILEEFKDRPEFKNAIKPCTSLDNFEKSCGLDGAANPKNDNDNDLVVCFLNKIGTKMTTCQSEHKSGDDTQKNCDPFPNLPEEKYENEEENQVAQPKFCPPPTQPKETKEKEEDGCKPAPTRPKKPAPLLPRPKTHLTEYWSDSWRTSTTPRILGKWKGRKIITTCEIVGEIINKSKGGTKSIDGCHPKNYDKKYAGWECDKSSNLVKENGICMSPRRQKLCVHYLKQSMTNSDGLKKAFVKCAAAETFLLWQYYKSKNGNAEDLDEKLKGGIIPEDFKRQMFYTFADYKDICLGTDLSSKTDIHSAVSIAKDNIYKVFNKIGQSSIHYRKKWWETNGPYIWKGMLCALSYDTSQNNVNQETRKKLTEGNNNFEKVIFGSDSSTTLSKFSERPQFLRWLTEWGEDFCKKRKAELDKLLGNCKDCSVSDSGTKDNTKTCDDKDKCDACKTACTTYKTWLKNWKTQYKTQSKKYSADKDNDPYKSIDEVKNSPNAYEYLYKQLKHFICENSDCNCMENSSKQQKQSSTDGDKMPKSMDDEPEDVKGKCNCVPNECNALSVSGSGIPDGQAFGGGVLDGTCKGLGEPKKKIEPPQYDPTNDILKSTIPVTIVLALGSIAFLFIK